MTDGRTFWWAKDTGWHRRELVVELGEDHGPGGPMVIDVLSAAAKDQRAGGRVRHGYRALAREAFVTADEARKIVAHAAEIGLLDDHVDDPDGRRFVCRLSGFKQDQDLAGAAARQAAKRARETEETQETCGELNVTSRDVTESQRDERDQPSPTGQYITEQDIGVVSPVVVGRAEKQDSTDLEVGLANHIAGILQRGIDGLTTDEGCKPVSVGAVLSVLRRYRPLHEIAEVVAVEVRSIAQSQNRAPNIVALFANRLEPRISVGGQAA